jgi:hypothetical protein
MRIRTGSEGLVRTTPQRRAIRELINFIRIRSAMGSTGIDTDQVGLIPAEIEATLSPLLRQRLAAARARG